MTVREARAIAKKYPTALVFEVVKPHGHVEGPRTGDVVTFAAVTGGRLWPVGVELVAPASSAWRGFPGGGYWAMEIADLRPLNAASRRALAQVSR